MNIMCTQRMSYQFSIRSVVQNVLRVMTTSACYLFCLQEITQSNTRTDRKIELGLWVAKVRIRDEHKN